MCFAPQRRARFQTAQLPKVLRTCGVLYILTWKCASRPTTACNFFISHLARWLRTRRFSEPTLRPSGATHHWKTQCFATFLPFRAPASSFFWLFLFSDLLSSTLLFSLTSSPSLLFHLSHIVGSLTSKLPSMNNYVKLYWYIYVYIYIYIIVKVMGRQSPAWCCAYL